MMLEKVQKFLDESPTVMWNDILKEYVSPISEDGTPLSHIPDYGKSLVEKIMKTILKDLYREEDIDNKKGSLTGYASEIFKYMNAKKELRGDFFTNVKEINTVRNTYGGISHAKVEKQIDKDTAEDFLKKVDEVSLVLLKFYDAHNGFRMKWDDDEKPAVSVDAATVRTFMEKRDMIDKNILIYFTLVGSWDGNNKRDREIVGKITGENYDSAMQKISFLKTGNLMACNGGVLKIKNRDILLEYLSADVSSTMLDTFGEYAADIFLEKESKCSEDLRTGFAEGLPLLRCLSEKFESCPARKGEDTARTVVQKVLNDAGSVQWGNLKREMPLFAESSPELFLNILEKKIRDDSFLKDLFGNKNEFFSGNNAAGTILALEVLMRDNSYFSRCCMILTRLAEFDSGGDVPDGSGPVNSLTCAFLPWFPQAGVTFEKRKKVFESIMDTNENIGWDLLVSLLPGKNESSPHIAKPKYCRPEKYTVGVSNSVYTEQIDFYFDRAVRYAGRDVKRVKDMLSSLYRAPDVWFEKIITHAADITRNMPEEESVSIWEYLIYERRFFSTDDEESVTGERSSGKERIDALIEELKPENPVHFYAHYFRVERAYFYGSNELDENDSIWDYMREKMREGVKKCFEFGGVDAVLSLYEKAGYRRSVGYSFGTSVNSGEKTGGAAMPAFEKVGERSAVDYAFSVAVDSGKNADDAILPALLNEKEKEQFVIGYLAGKYEKEGDAWIREMIERYKKERWDKNDILMFYRLSPFVSAFWRKASEELGESEKDYWSTIPYDFRILIDEDINFVVKKLTEYGNTALAIHCLRDGVYGNMEIDTDIAINALRSFRQNTDNEKTDVDYDIRMIIDFLQKKVTEEHPGDAYAEKISEIEWMYNSVFNKYESFSTQKFLHQRLSSDPHFFLKILGFMSGKEQDNNITDEKKREFATRAFLLLGRWKTPIGIDENGEIDAEKVAEWIRVVIDESKENGHLNLSSEYIGQALKNSPRDPDGLFIHKIFADILDKDDDEMYDYIRGGYMRALYNSMGVMTDSERIQECNRMSEIFRKRAEELDMLKFHKFAGTCRNISDLFEREAEATAESEKKEKAQIYV